MIKIDVDMVFTYVNGNDKNYMEKRNKFILETNYATNFDPDIRRININEIKYSVKSVIKKIPWIRKIFIVTDNQIPPINEKLINSGKVIIIDHKKIIDKQYLPTFNSNVIESFIYRIPGLSEIFLYNNDDCMHFKKVKREDIYSINKGKIKLIVRDNFDIEKFKEKETEFRRRILITSEILTLRIPTITLLNNHHTKILRKSTLLQIEDNFPDLLHNLRIRHFRSNNYISYLFFAMNIDNYLNKNIVIPFNEEVLEKHFTDKEYTDELFDNLLEKAKKAKFVCLNSMPNTFKKGFQGFVKKILG